jgi:hypothetical protein
MPPFGHFSLIRFGKNGGEGRDTGHDFASDAMRAAG